MGLDQVSLLVWRLDLKQLLHADQYTVHCPFENDLLFFDLWIHEISCEEKDHLRVESLLSDLFYENSHLENLSFLSVWLDALHGQFLASVFEHDTSSDAVEEDVLLSLLWGRPQSICVYLGEFAVSTLFLNR